MCKISYNADNQNVKYRNLSISAYNIQGISNKLDDTEFVNMLKKYDIIVLTETWLPEDQTITIDGYCNTNFNIYRKKNKNARRCSGGISVLIKNQLYKGISIIKKSTNILWFKLRKTFFKAEHDIFVGGIYFPPINSSFVKSNMINSDDQSPFDLLQNDISKYSDLGQILLMGDLNARCGTELEITSPEYEIKIDSDVCNITPTSSNKYDIISRNNRDEKVNSYGRDLIKVCKSNDMCIINGRKTGDTLGQFTCFQPKGASVVDYAICSISMFNMIDYFVVNNLQYFSDHCMISAHLKIPQKSEFSIIKKNRDTTSFNKFKWNSIIADKFSSELNSNDVKNRINKILTYSYDNINDGINSCANDLSDIIISTANKCCPKRSNIGSQNKNKKKWKDITVNDLKKELQSLGKLLQKNPFCQNTQNSYFSKKKLLKRKIKNNNKNFKNQLFQKLLELETSKPKEYWKMVDILKNKKKNNNIIDENEFFNHFQTLHSKDFYSQNHFDKNFETKIINELTIQKNNFESIYCPNIDDNFSLEEIKKEIKSLPNNKACGLDGILNEMLKVGIDSLLNQYTNYLISS